MPTINEDPPNQPMPIGSAGHNATNSNGNGDSFRSRLLWGVAGFFLMTMVYNVFFRDYTAETKGFLVASGRADAIDRVIPPTQADLAQASYNEKRYIAQLGRNMTLLMENYAILRSDVDQLVRAQQQQQQQQQPQTTLPTVPVPAAAPSVRRRRLRRRR